MTFKELNLKLQEQFTKMCNIGKLFCLDISGEFKYGDSNGLFWRYCSNENPLI